MVPQLEALVQNKRVVTGTNGSAITSGQSWQGKLSRSPIDILGPDPQRPGRWMALVHRAEATASFSEDDIRQHFDLLD